MSNLVLQNKNLLVCINSVGATLLGVFDKVNSKELLWQGDKKSWNEKDICIFPHVARLKDGWYTVDGVEYELPIHGLCKFYYFKVKKHTTDMVEMFINYNEESLRMYPYKFEFTAKFELEENKLKVTYIVKNLDDKTIYYGIGGHPGFALDGVTKWSGSDISGNTILLNDADEYTKITMDKSNFFVRGKENFCAPQNKINLSKDVFANDAIILCNNFGGATLEKKNGGKIVFETDSTYLAFWSHAKFGEYVCFEPWWTLPDDENPKRELKDKSSIISLGVGESREYSYSVKIVQ